MHVSSTRGHSLKLYKDRDYIEIQMLCETQIRFDNRRVEKLNEPWLTISCTFKIDFLSLYINLLFTCRPTIENTLVNKLPQKVINAK